jgi:chitodextrinase
MNSANIVNVKHSPVNSNGEMGNANQQNLKNKGAAHLQAYRYYQNTQGDKPTTQKNFGVRNITKSNSPTNFKLKIE